MEIIARIHTDFPEKFGIPRQSCLVEELEGRIVFESKYRSVDAVKGLEGFDYIWLLWQFDNPPKDNWSATVKPPRLGGNKKMGVFATRSPFRPNPIGLSCVKLLRIEYNKNGPELIVAGADLRDQTLIYDVKPYLPYVDSHPDARAGFGGEHKDDELEVVFPNNLLQLFPKQKQNAIIQVLKQDPRPSYQEDPTRNYGVSFAGFDVHFSVVNNVLTVYEVVKIGDGILELVHPKQSK